MDCSFDCCVNHLRQCGDRVHVLPCLIDKIKLEVSDLKICFCDGRFSFVRENFMERDERGTGKAVLLFFLGGCVAKDG